MRIQNLLLCIALNLFQIIKAQTFELHNSINFSDLNDGRDLPDGITWFKPGALSYGIYRTNGSWSSPNYQQLKLSFDTGIIIDGGYQHGRSGTVLQPNGGNVGIGMDNPRAKLDVFGQINSHNASFGQFDALTSTKNYANFSSDNHGSVLISSNLYFSSNNFLKIANSHGSISGGAILIPGNGQLNQGKILFYTNEPKSVLQDQDYTGNLSMAIAGNGNVGIGTTNPTSKLTVAGNIASREVKVTVDAGADFVFEKDYDLPSLESVDKFIKKNKHLPEIASAKEMQKDGINLSEMNIKLLQKIEELTLYVIEMKKENENMKKENDLMKINQMELMVRIKNIENK
ncbi:tail fiber protein [Flavobacterium seoulense]|uniref:Uncharacterized protein n=1 Tax=Flavobacterium seoulense TaxID=1492738 RepID=A0A066WLG1_9FLAO|nr:tail fiber protein [Flavobacterium seoulense]KDN54706.1 hypothetical protein FEM21_22200 [Flavobacterium seoulense]